ncbi:MAG: glycosyltransferase family 4 protein [Bacteroidota bacterium]|nr:glycosyltransferase family 4 protein [Bacteroidota bacterium]
MQKVLIVTYYWPPGSGAGVQRWLKFSKYLPANGWQPIILTVDPQYAAYSALDRDLSDEVPSDLVVYKTKATDYFRLYRKDKSKIPSAGFAINDQDSFTSRISRFIRGNFFIPDPRKGWNKYAYREACRLIISEKISHIITTSPPHSTQLIGLKLRKKFPELKWIADLRDPWTDIYYYNQFYPAFISRKIDSCYEKKVLRSADKIITVGKSLMELFTSKVPGIRSKFTVITNGYDAEDFEGQAVPAPSGFMISYIGTLSDAYPVDGFLRAIKTLKWKGLKFSLRFVGLVSSGKKEMILSAAGESVIEFLPYASHPEAISYMQNSSLLLLIIPDHRSNKSIITGKLFEYLASERPIICIGPPEGDAAIIIGECGHGSTFTYDDWEGVAGYIETLIDKPFIQKTKSPSAFRRDNLVKDVAATLNQS